MPAGSGIIARRKPRSKLSIVGASLDRAHELLARAALTGTLDFAEAMAAFRDKREPRFRGT